MLANLLLIDDDARLTGLLRDYLGQAGYHIEVADSLARAQQRVAQGGIDLLVLDLMLPDGDGLDLCRALRSHTQTQDLPLLMLTARGEPLDRVLGLEMGADDYLSKPFEARELLARVKALLRRRSRGIPAATAVRQGHDEAGEQLVFGRLVIDVLARQVRLAGQLCELTGYQFDLLLVLARSPGRVLSRDYIMDALKGPAFEVFDRSIDVHVSRIRAAIEDDPKAPRRILTVRNVGYVFAKTQDV